MEHAGTQARRHAGTEHVGSRHAGAEHAGMQAQSTQACRRRAHGHTGKARHAGTLAKHHRGSLSGRSSNKRIHLLGGNFCHTLHGNLQSISLATTEYCEGMKVCQRLAVCVGVGVKKQANESAKARSKQVRVCNRNCLSACACDTLCRVP